MALNDKDPHPDDARIAAIYRGFAAEEPPAAVDAAVLRNARGALAAAGGRESRTAWWMPWRIPLAFAAMAVLSVSLVLVVEREGGEPLKLEQTRRDAPASVTASSPVQPQAVQQPPPGVTAEARPQTASPAPPPKADARRDEAQSSDRKDAFTAGRLEERARAAREEPPSPAALQKKLEAPRESTMLRDAAPTRDAKALGSAASASRGTESEAGANVQAPASSPAPAPAAAPPPAAPAPERQPAMAAPAAALEPVAKPYAAPAPKPQAAQRRSAASDTQSPTVRSLIAELEQRPAFEWRARIAALRREERTADADALVVEFKRRFPDEAPPPPEP